MGKKGKYSLTDKELFSLNRFYDIKSKVEDKSVDEVKKDIQNYIISELFNDYKLKSKINSMVSRNYIPYGSLVHEDVFQETFFQLSRVDINELFLTYCDSPTRLFGLCVKICYRTGLGKLSQNISPNQSVAKQILFTSNLKNLFGELEFDTINDIDVIEKNEYFKPDYLDEIEKKLFYIPDELKDEVKVFELIKKDLNTYELDFLYFILNNVFNKKKNVYNSDLRNKYYSFNEYRIKLLMLTNRIKEIVEKNNYKI